MQPHGQPVSGPMGPPGHFGNGMMPPFIPPGMPMGPPAGPARPSGTDLDALLSKQTVQGRARTERYKSCGFPPIASLLLELCSVAVMSLPAVHVRLDFPSDHS